jgi:hypothetical protein
MTKSNEILRTLLSNFPLAELSSGEQQSAFESLKNRLIEAPDSGVELKNLYKVTGFSQFAMGLMWMLDRAESNPGQIALGLEDETLLLSSFRKAMAEHPSLGQQSTSAAEVEEVRGGEIGEVDEKGFAGQVEQFSESVQSGSGGTKMFLEDLVTECDTIARQGGPSELVEFGFLLAEFLRFILERELLDDVRVINIVSNVSSTVSQWANTPPDARSGIMEEALNMLRDFKSQFE